MLVETPLCLPAFFTLAGTGPGEGCVIERSQTRAAVREMPAAIANHWTALPESGRPRGIQSRRRHLLMEEMVASGGDRLISPILNRCTRLTAEMNPANGHLEAQGWERGGLVTAPFNLVLQ